MRLTLSFTLLFCGLLLSAQRQNGMAADNYAGFTSAQFNPANLADSRFKFNMNVIGFNAHLQNNYIQMETPFSMYKFLYWSLDSNFGKQNFDYPFEEHYITERLNGRKKHIYTNTQVNVLSAQFGLNDKSGVSIGITTKSYAKISGIPENGIKTFLQDLDTLGYIKKNQERLVGQTIDISNSGAAVLAYQQYSLKYALVVKEKKNEFIKVGFGIDYNVGLYGGYFKSGNVSYTLTGIDTLLTSETDLEIGYIDPAYTSDPARRLNDYFGKSKLGKGFGINLGVVYEHRPDGKAKKYKMNRKSYEDRSENKYDWKVAASIVDLGFVKFSNGDATRSIEIKSPQSEIQWNDFDEADGWKGVEDADSFINSFFDNVSRSNSFRMFTPASLNLSGDFKYKDNLYLSAMYSQSLTSNKAKGVKMPSVLSISPRYEAKWLTVALPLSFSRYYNIVNLGAYVRGGIFYLGSDNLGGFFTGKKTNGVNIYAGFNWPIHYSKLKDMDGDGISDDLDQCPSMAGTRYTEGCPDADGDKIADDEDECPNEPGKKRTNGCPDKDNDKVADKDDKCPDVYGDKDTDGCPDTDGDGIHDGVDKCPAIAGEKRYDGCAEAQKDTTPKVIDKAPTDTIKQATPRSRFEKWDFNTYVYWPVLGAYNDIRWAEELQQRLKTKLNVNTTIKTIPGVSTYYITLGQASNLEEAKEIQKVLDKPLVNEELNGSLWWKKVKK